MPRKSRFIAELTRQLNKSKGRSIRDIFKITKKKFRINKRNTRDRKIENRSKSSGRYKKRKKKKQSIAQ